MKRIAPLWLAALLLWPLAGHADDIDIPELGVKLTTLPAEASKPEITSQPGGSTATTQLGPAQLSIYRDAGSAPADSDVAAPAYRASLDARFGRVSDSKTQGAPTDIDGHSGWTVVTVRPDSSAGTTRYLCVTYVLVEQHLYRLTVSASGTPARPPEFDALVNALSGIRFEPPAAAHS
jgi:hypothetical protein